MIEIRPEANGYVEMECTSQEWGSLLAVVETADGMYDALELDNSVSHFDLRGLMFAMHEEDESGALLTTKQMKDLLCVVLRTETMVVSEFSAEDHQSLVKQIEDMDCANIFVADAGGLEYD